MVLSVRQAEKDKTNLWSLKLTMAISDEWHQLGRNMIQLTGAVEIFSLVLGNWYTDLYMCRIHLAVGLSFYGCHNKLPQFNSWLSVGRKSSKSLSGLKSWLHQGCIPFWAFIGSTLSCFFLLRKSHPFLDSWPPFFKASEVGFSGLPSAPLFCFQELLGLQCVHMDNSK